MQQEELQVFKAPEGWIYIHNVRGVENYGEVVVATQQYPIDDYHLVSLDEFNELMAQRQKEVK